MWLLASHWLDTPGAWSSPSLHLLLILKPTSSLSLLPTLSDFQNFMIVGVVIVPSTTAITVIVTSNINYHYYTIILSKSLLIWHYEYQYRQSQHHNYQSPIINHDGMSPSFSSSYLYFHHLVIVLLAIINSFRLMFEAC